LLYKMQEIITKRGDRMKSVSFFLMGLGTGAALAMLYSPKTGADNRDLLKRRTQEGTDYVKHSASQSAGYLKRQSADLGRSAAEKFERGKAAAMVPLQELATAIETGKQAYSDAVRTSTPEAGA